MRFEFICPEGKGVGWARSFEDAGYSEVTLSSSESEKRYSHPEGSVARMFFDANGFDHCYIYPPGGTDAPTGPIVVPSCFPKKASKLKQATGSPQ